MQEELDFEKLEKLLWKGCLNLFQQILVEALEQYDQELMKKRDKNRFEIKEKNPRSIQTLVGTIDFKRRYYWDIKEHRWVFLLDEALEIEAEKTISPGLLQLAVTWATKGPSYRDSRDRLTDLFGAQVLSHEAIRQALLEVGAACDRDLENEIVKQEGKKEVDVLFIEVDGFGTRLQKTKKLKRQNCRREAKMAVIHEGWTRRSNSNNSDYELKNPTYISNLKESDDFFEHVRGVIGTIYKDIDNILIVINGDGAPWIREGATYFAKGIYQYDRFHIAKEIRTALRHSKDELFKAQRALRKNEMATLLCVVTEALLDCEDDKQKEKITELRDLLLADHEFIIDYRVRLKNSGFKVPEEWRGLGAAESNVNKFKNRTGKRGRAWSPEGLTAILTTLSRLFDGTLHKSISRTLDAQEKWILDKLTSGVGHITRKIQSEPIGVKTGAFPAARNGTKGYSKLFNGLQNVEVF